VNTPRGLRSSALALAVLASLAASSASAEQLTAEQVLQLRQSGVSDETIQKMLDQGSGSGSSLPAPLQQQAEATDHIGAYDLPDGTHILSTGKSDLPNHYYDPTIDSGGGSQYPIQVYPFVSPYGPGPGGAAGGGPARVLEPR
jgi:hypothetical protein